jgi:hypothetical protein
MPALSRRPPLEADHTAQIISLAELNRARSRRALNLAPDDGLAEAHPWAYCFPRPVAVTRHG